MRLGLLALIVIAACDPSYRYRVVARNAAQAGEPVAHARLGISCDGAPFSASSITEADGSASIAGPGFGLPASCRLELRHRTFLAQSVELPKVCTRSSQGHCRSAEWTAKLLPAAEFEQPLPAPAQVSDCQRAGDQMELATFAGIGTLHWQPCVASGLLAVESELRVTGPAPVLGSVPIDTADDVEVRDRFLSLDATWVAAVLHQGRALGRGETETLLVLRLEDTGALFIVYQGEPKAKGALQVELADLDGEPELRLSASGHPTVSFRPGASGELEPWTNPLASAGQ
jgi:hypothetical protein